jgi:hypothetical protein
MSANQRIRELVDGYIASAFPGGIPAMQSIEIRLAFYAGMAAMVGENVRIAKTIHDENAAMKAMSDTHQAICERALTLNKERANRP